MPKEVASPVGDFSLAIAQGRNVKVAVLPLADILKAAKTVGRIAQSISVDVMTANSETAFNVGEAQCEYCEAKPICPAFTATMFEHLAKGCPDEMPLATVLDIYHMLPMFKKFAEALTAHVESLYADGVIGEADGVKQVVSRAGGLAWKDEAEAFEVLNTRFRIKRDDLYAKIISPAEAKKLLGITRSATAEAFEALTVRKPDSLAVVSVSDPRPAVVPVSVDDLTSTDDELNDLLS